MLLALNMAILLICHHFAALFIPTVKLWNHNGATQDFQQVFLGENKYTAQTRNQASNSHQMSQNRCWG